MPAFPPLLRGGRSLLFLVGAGLLLIVLTACAGGGDETAASSPGTDTPPGTEPPDTEPPGNEPPGTNPPGNEPPGTEPPDTEPPGNEPPGTNPPGNQPPSDTDTSIRGLDCLNEEGEDCDGDGHNDSVDIDDDGDGLIEIATAEELNAVRYALNGNGSKSSADAAFDTTGCGGVDGITNCSGYELVADISLAAYADTDGGRGWRPLGNDTNSARNGCQGTGFNATFEGNGFRISDLVINRPDEDCVGLFGHTAEQLNEIGNPVNLGVEIRNLSLHAETIVGDDNVGSLMGYMVNATISYSSVSIGNISGKSDVGGLVGDGNYARVYSSSVVAGEVSGTGANVGGLIGDGEWTQVRSSSVVARKVSGGGDNVGGLVGYGDHADARSSSVVAGEVSGAGDHVGGLMGWCQFEWFVSSLVVAGEVSGNNDVGGLAGSCSLAQIYSSSVVAGEVSGNNVVGGLVGNSGRGIYSSSVVVTKVKGSSRVGGLAGQIGRNEGIAYSYVVSGSSISMLVGSGSGIGVASYWDSETSGRGNGNHGQAKTSEDLRMPTGYEGIYAKWDNETNIFIPGRVDRRLAVWCDEDTSRAIEAAEQINDNLIWDFGTSSQYPAIRCTPIAPSEWRSWWSLNGTGKPQLNRTRLDEWLP